jgi:hypothetical protein
MLAIFRWAALIAAVFFFVALAGAIISSKSPQSPVPQQAAEKNSEEQADKGSNKAIRDWWFPDSISFYTFFLVIFTVLLAFVGVYQLNLLGRAEQISARSADAAKQAADAARDAVQLSDRIAERQLRAYITMKSTGPLEVVTFGNKDKYGNIIWKIRFVARNSGITPASKLEFFYNHSLVPIGDIPESGIPDPPDFSNDGESVTSVTGAGDDAKGGYLEITGNFLNDVATWKLKWFAFAVIRYRDVFDKERLTQYCVVVSIPSGFDYNSLNAPSFTSSASACNKYNGIDETIKAAERFRLPPTQ